MSLWTHRAPTPRCSCVDDGSPERRARRPARGRRPASSAASCTAASRPTAIAVAANVGLRARARRPSATRSCSPRTSGSSSTAGSTRMRARTDTQGRPAAVVGGRLLHPNGLLAARRHVLLAPAAASSATASAGPRRPARGARALPLPGHRRAAAHPPRDARRRSASTTRASGSAGRTSTTACASFDAGLECIYEPAARALPPRAAPAVGRPDAARHGVARSVRSATCGRSTRRRDLSAYVPTEGLNDHDADAPPHPVRRHGQRPASPGTAARCPRCPSARTGSASPASRRTLEVMTGLHRDAARASTTCRLRRRRPPAAARRGVADAIRALQDARRRRAVRDRRLRAGRAQDGRPRRPRPFGHEAPRAATSMCMRACDGIICSTEWLAARYRAFNPRRLGVPQRARPRPLRR